MVKESSPIKELNEVTGGLIGGQSPPRYDKLESPSQRKERPPGRWWKASVLGGLIFIAVVVVVVTVAVTAVPKHGHAKAAPEVVASQPAPAVNTNSMISEACNGSTYADLCRSSLSAYPGASMASVKDLVGIGLQIAKENATAGWEVALEFLSRGPGGGSQLLLGAMKDCNESMESSLDTVNHSIAVYENLSADKDSLVGQLSDIQTYMSAGIEFVETCCESLAETDENASKLFRVQSETAREMISVSLGLVNYWAENVDASSHNRRLLSSSRSGLVLDARNDRSEAQNVLETVVSAGKVVEVAGTGSGKAARCVLNCFRADPVCGEDGVTYWCGTADAKCAGVEVAHVGFCNIENGGAGGKGSRAGQSLLLVHLVWLFLAGLLVLIELP